MRILLIDTDTNKPRIAPIGLEYLGEYLTMQGHEVKIVEVFDKRPCFSGTELIGIGIRNIDNTGFPEVEFYLPAIKKLIARIKKESTVPIVIGGSAVNLMPKEIKDYVGADCAISSKGFRIFDSLLNKVEIGIIPESVCIDKNDYVLGRFRRNLIPHKIYTRKGTGVGVATKFGCMFSCVYCDYPISDGCDLREREPEDVVSEIWDLNKEGIEHIFFADSTFNASPTHAVQILNLLKRHGIKVSWEGFINPNPSLFTDEFFTKLVESGKKSVTLGADSISEQGLKILKKPFSIEDIFRATRMCQSKGINVNFSLLFGHPDETKESVVETFTNLDELRPTHIDVVIGIRLFPGTPITSLCIDRGILSKNQSLLLPFYIPVKREIKRKIIEETSRRLNCHLSSVNSLKRYGRVQK